MGDEPFENFTVREWLAEWLGKKEASRDRFAHLGMLADLPLRAASPTDVCSLRDRERQQGKGPVTANLAHKVIAFAFEAAKRQGYIDANPRTQLRICPLIRPRSRRRPSRRRKCLAC